MAICSGDWTLLNYDPKLKRHEWGRFDTMGRLVEVRSEYEVDEALRVNHHVQMETMNRRWTDWTPIASVPMNIHFDVLGEAFNDGDDAYVNKWLNDADNRAFRMKEGTV